MRCLGKTPRAKVPAHPVSPPKPPQSSGCLLVLCVSPVSGPPLGDCDREWSLWAALKQSKRPPWSAASQIVEGWFWGRRSPAPTPGRPVPLRQPPAVQRHVRRVPLPAGGGVGPPANRGGGRPPGGRVCAARAVLRRPVRVAGGLVDGPSLCETGPTGQWVSICWCGNQLRDAIPMSRWQPGGPKGANQRAGLSLSVPPESTTLNLCCVRLLRAGTFATSENKPGEQQ